MLETLKRVHELRPIRPVDVFGNRSRTLDNALVACAQHGRREEFLFLRRVGAVDRRAAASRHSQRMVREALRRLPREEAEMAKWLRELAAPGMECGDGGGQASEEDEREGGPSEEGGEEMESDEEEERHFDGEPSRTDSVPESSAGNGDLGELEWLEQELVAYVSELSLQE